jgi:hypothetical protein
MRHPELDRFQDGNTPGTARLSGLQPDRDLNTQAITNIHKTRGFLRPQGSHGLENSWIPKITWTDKIPRFQNLITTRIPGLQQSRDSNNPRTRTFPGLQQSRDSNVPGTPAIPGLQQSRDSNNPGTRVISGLE